MSIVTEYRLGEEQIHDILSNTRRRQTLVYLKRSHELELRALAETIAERESGESPPPTPLRQSVYNSLHQTHLPKLDDLNIVDYDSDRKVVSLRPEARTVDLYMEVITPLGITWSTYYRTLAVLALFVVIGNELESIPPNNLTILFASFFLLTIAVSTVYQLWSNDWTWNIRNRLGI